MRDLLYASIVGFLVYTVYKATNGFKAIGDYIGAVKTEYDAKQQYAAQIAFQEEITDPILKDIAQRTGLAVKTMDDVFAYEKMGKLVYNEWTGFWETPAQYYGF